MRSGANLHDVHEPSLREQLTPVSLKYIYYTAFAYHLFEAPRILLYHISRLTLALSVLCQQNICIMPIHRIGSPWYAEPGRYVYTNRAQSLVPPQERCHRTTGSRFYYWLSRRCGENPGYVTVETNVRSLAYEFGPRGHIK